MSTIISGLQRYKKEILLSFHSSFYNNAVSKQIKD